MDYEKIEQLVQAIYKAGEITETLTYVLLANAAVHESGYHPDVTTPWAVMTEAFANGDKTRGWFNAGLALGTWSRLKARPERRVSLEGEEDGE